MTRSPQTENSHVSHARSRFHARSNRYPWLPPTIRSPSITQPRHHQDRTDLRRNGTRPQDRSPQSFHEQDYIGSIFQNTTHNRAYSSPDFGYDHFDMDVDPPTPQVRLDQIMRTDDLPKWKDVLQVPATGSSEDDPRNSQLLDQGSERVPHILDNEILPPPALMIYEVEQSGNDAPQLRILPLVLHEARGVASLYRPVELTSETNHQARESSRPDIDEVIGDNDGPIFWPPGAVPVEIFRSILSTLARKDIKNLRMVNKEFEQKVSSAFFDSVVVPFNTEIYEMVENDRNLRRETKYSDNPATALYWQNAHLDEDDKVYKGHGLSVFSGFGKYIRNFGMSFEVTEKAICAAPTKTKLDNHESYFGSYAWPPETYRRYDHFDKLEQAANEVSHMRTAFSRLTKTRKMALSLDDGLGHLRGPDRSLRSRLMPASRPIFDDDGLQSCSEDNKASAFWRYLTEAHEKHPNEVELRDMQIYLAKLRTPPSSIPGLTNTVFVDSSSWLVFDSDFIPGLTEHQPQVNVNMSRHKGKAAVRKVDTGLFCFLPTHYRDSELDMKNLASRDMTTNRLSNDQREWLSEASWAQSAFLQSYMLAVIDIPAIFASVSVLNLDAFPSSLIHVIARPDFWEALSGLTDLNLRVRPAWRSITRDEAGVLRDNNVRPSCACDAVYKLLEEYIANMPTLRSLSIGWADGGETAEGTYSRNQHILPAPVTSLENVLKDGRQDFGTLILPHIEHLTLVNCWIYPSTVSKLVNRLEKLSLKSITFESVSLSALPAPQHIAALQAVIAQGAMVNQQAFGQQNAAQFQPGANNMPQAQAQAYLNQLNNTAFGPLGQGNGSQGNNNTFAGPASQNNHRPTIDPYWPDTTTGRNEADEVTQSIPDSGVPFSDNFLGLRQARATQTSSDVQEFVRQYRRGPGEQDLVEWARQRYRSLLSLVADHLIQFTSLPHLDANWDMPQGTLSAIEQALRAIIIASDSSLPGNLAARGNLPLYSFDQDLGAYLDVDRQRGRNSSVATQEVIAGPSSQSDGRVESGPSDHDDANARRARLKFELDEERRRIEDLTEMRLLGRLQTINADNADRRRHEHLLKHLRAERALRQARDRVADMPLIGMGRLFGPARPAEAGDARRGRGSSRLRGFRGTSSSRGSYLSRQHGSSLRSAIQNSSSILGGSSVAQGGGGGGGGDDDDDNDGGNNNDDSSSVLSSTDGRPNNPASQPPPANPPADPEWQAAYRIRPGSWAGLLDTLSPSVTLSNYRPLASILHDPPVARNTPLQSITLKSCGYVKLNNTDLNERALPESEWDDEDDAAKAYRERVRAQIGKRMMVPEDSLLGTIVQGYDEWERDLLVFAWGCRTGWPTRLAQKGNAGDGDSVRFEDQRFWEGLGMLKKTGDKEAAVFDGYRVGGSGRYSGRVEKGMDANLELVVHPVRYPEDDEE